MVEKKNIYILIIIIWSHCKIMAWKKIIMFKIIYFFNWQYTFLILYFNWNLRSSINKNIFQKSKSLVIKYVLQVLMNAFFVSRQKLIAWTMPLSPPGPLVRSRIHLTTIYYIYIPYMVINCLSTGERSLRTRNGDDDDDSRPIRELFVIAMLFWNFRSSDFT